MLEYLTTGSEFTFQPLLRGDSCGEEAPSEFNTAATQAHSQTSSQSTIGVHFRFQPEPEVKMGDQAMMTDDMGDVPSISYNLPPIRQFTGRRHDCDVFGIVH